MNGSRCGWRITAARRRWPGPPGGTAGAGLAMRATARGTAGSPCHGLDLCVACALFGRRGTHSGRAGAIQRRQTVAESLLAHCVFASAHGQPSHEGRTGQRKRPAHCADGDAAARWRSTIGWRSITALSGTSRGKVGASKAWLRGATAVSFAPVAQCPQCFAKGSLRKRRDPVTAG